MKKFAITAIAAAAVLGAGAAHAYTTGTFNNGFVVPNVLHTTDGSTTSVGIISATAGPVFWTFFDQDSGHGRDGCFDVTANDFTPFVWSKESGLSMEGKRGYLVFVAGNTAAKCVSGQQTVSGNTGSFGSISGSAFFVDPVNKDVAFTPVIDGPLTFAANTNLSTMGETSLVGVGGAAPIAAPGATTFSMRYYIDNAAGGNDTNIFVWSTGSQKGTHTVFMYDDKQGSASVNFKLDHTELDAFNPETIPGRPAAYLDGFINWTPTLKNDDGTANVTGSMFVYSVISAPAFGAVQSILGAYR